MLETIVLFLALFPTLAPADVDTCDSQRYTENAYTMREVLPERPEGLNQ